MCKILAAHAVKPHKVRYYLERRDPEFEPKMAEVLCVYREVEMRRAAGHAGEAAVAVVCYDEKPGIQAIATTAPDRPPVPGSHPTISRDHEYKRHGTVTLMAGIDLLTGQVHALVKDRHRSREFVEFLGRLDAAYPAATAIEIILDNHSAHISRETKTWLAARPEGRFQLVFTPKHGSWLNLIEGFFAKAARSVPARGELYTTGAISAGNRYPAYGCECSPRTPAVHKPKSDGTIDRGKEHQSDERLLLNNAPWRGEGSDADRRRAPSDRSARASTELFSMAK